MENINAVRMAVAKKMRTSTLVVFPNLSIYFMVSLIFVFLYITGFKPTRNSQLNLQLLSRSLHCKEIVLLSLFFMFYKSSISSETITWQTRLLSQKTCISRLEV